MSLLFFSSGMLVDARELNALFVPSVPDDYEVAEVENDDLDDDEVEEADEAALTGIGCGGVAR